MNFRIDEVIIKRLASNLSVFRSGQTYFAQKRVSDIELDSEHGVVRATVEGTDDYSVAVEFDNNGFIDEHYCDCPAHATYDGACKHVVAVLLAAHKKSMVSSSSVRDSSLGQLITLYEYMSADNVKEIVRLDITISIERYYNKLLPSMELKLGTSKLYIVKSLEEFIEKLIAGSSIEFGKGFSFNPAKQGFSDVDSRIIQLLRELYELEGLHKTLSVYSYSSPPSSFRGKKVYLTQSTFKRVLELLEDRQFYFLMGNHEFSARIVKEDLPIQFELKKHGGSMKLSLPEYDLPIAITQDSKYFVQNEAIYKISDRQQRYIVPVLSSFTKTKAELVLKGEDSSRFVSSVLPYISKVSTINIDPAVESSIIQSELATKLYLDKVDESITARLSFNYEACEVNPFTAKANIMYDEKIILRDIEREKSILGYFENDDFKVKNGIAYLENEENIDDFLLLTLPKLQAMVEVYYSEEFKKINVRDSRAFTAGVRLNSQTSMLEFSFQHDNIEADELTSVLDSLRLKKKYYRLRDGSFIPLNDSSLEGFSELVEALDISEEELSRQMVSLPSFRAMYLDNQLKQLKLHHIERSQYFKQLVQNITEPEDMEYELPTEVNSIMREYQKTGFKWLSTLSNYKMGGILADDMGLGKTLQTIAFILANKEKDKAPCLVVAPTSLLYNWQEEVSKFAPSLRVAVISGPAAQRQELIADIEGSDIVVTSYPLIRRDIELYKNIQFSYCFIDEAQHIKNPDSVNARSVKKINAKGYFALTGTPIENSLTELWSIFDFVLPGYLLTHRKFVEKYERPIVKNGDKTIMERLRSQIRPFILRRLKRDVLKELPEKIETRMVAELSPEQKKLYLAYLQQAKVDIAKDLQDKGFEKSHIKILSILTRLRQICCHPAMFLEDYEGDSGKLELLEEIIQEALDGGHRILLFSQFTSMLHIIEQGLRKNGIEYFYLDGSTPIEQRADMVKRFNNGEGKVFLISLKAGGTGLNLTGADTVIHFDPWWNPAVEDQATDRAHRIGQKNTVQVIKLITKGTIEEKVYALQQKKKNLIEALVQPEETFITKLSETEIKSLFDI